ncbi:MAG TPA: PPOX class F420-dependent oxidoreductase [Acidimicrobiales bacterium]|nr:PPOX class F420-dependent oxidoreductase [Acidimicrobiales bacterium]
MEIAEALDFIRENHRAVLATRRADGRPQMSPVMAGVDEEGFVEISSRETAMKVLNARRDPAVSLCVFPDGFFGSWVQVDGVASVVSLPEAMDRLVALYRRMAGEHPDWDEYRTAMGREKRVVLRIAVDSAGPTRAG